MRKLFSSVAAILTIASTTCVEAAPAYSWNLSRDMMNGITTNPIGEEGVWTAMYDIAGTSHNASNYQTLSSYTSNYAGYPLAALGNGYEGWLIVGVSTQTHTFSGSPIAIRRGIPILHPGVANSSIIRWKSPISGNITIAGKIADANPLCGNGINWFIDKYGTTLMLGSLANGDNGANILQQNIPVSVGTYLYFIVSSKDYDQGCDSTFLDITVTSP